MYTTSVPCTGSNVSAMAASAPHSQAKEDSFVAQDMIWKAHVKKEVEAAKKWPEEWGFLTTPFTEVTDEEKGTTRETAIRRSRTSAGPVHHPVENLIKVDPSPPVPQTTQGLVGWRSTVPALQLERYGKTKHPKGDFCKRMNWPAEGIA
ncbi:ciliary microtubule inner protein 1 [Lithobates pipiens]